MANRPIFGPGGRIEPYRPHSDATKVKMSETSKQRIKIKRGNNRNPVELTAHAKIAAALRANPTKWKKDIAAEFGVSQSTVSYIVRKIRQGKI